MNGGARLSKINVNHIVSESKFNRFHFGLLFWSCFIIMFDSYDLVVYSSVLPVLIKEWSISPVQAGAIGSYGPFGMMIGAILFGILADKFGRKKVLIASIVLFSIFGLLCGFASGPTSFSIFRFLCGLGIGGILPNTIALLTDYAPKTMKNTMVQISMIFFPIGGMLAAFLAIFLIPAFGWQSVYWIAVLPLLCLPVMVRNIHDSPSILLSKGRIKELKLVLSKINTKVSFTSDMQFEDSQEKEPSSPIVALFKNNRALGTIMIWIAFFMCLLMVNGITIWLPGFMVNAGYNLGSSLTFMLVYNAGTIIGTLILGNLADKWGAKKVLVPMFLIAAVCLSLFGIKNNMVILYLLIGLTGACTMGAQNISYSFVSQYYPSFMRSTAIGLASGVGRIGAIIGPLLGGFLVSLSLPVQLNFMSFAVPGIIAAIAFSFVSLKLADNKKMKKEIVLADQGVIDETKI